MVADPIFLQSPGENFLKPVVSKVKFVRLPIAKPHFQTFVLYAQYNQAKHNNILPDCFSNLELKVLQLRVIIWVYLIK